MTCMDHRCSNGSKFEYVRPQKTPCNNNLFYVNCFHIHHFGKGDLKWMLLTLGKDKN